MHIASEFVVQAEPDHVFETLLNPLVMRDCIPGCTELLKTDETHYGGKLTDEIAHVKFNANFVAELTELNQPKNIKVVLSGDDHKLATSISVVISLEVDSHDSGSKVRYDMDLAIRGRLGRLGEPIIRRRSAEVERDFVAALTQAVQSSTVSAGNDVPFAGSVLLAPSEPSAAGVKESSHQRSGPTVRDGWLRHILAFFRRKR